MDAQFVQQDFLVLTRFRDATFADFYSFSRWKDDVHDADVLKFFEDTARFVAQSGPLTQAGECLPQHVRQEAVQDVSQHAVFFLVPDRQP